MATVEFSVEPCKTPRTQNQGRIRMLFYDGEGIIFDGNAYDDPNAVGIASVYHQRHDMGALFAAAPDLLEACRQAAILLEREGVAAQPDADAINAIHAAIAKATAQRGDGSPAGDTQGRLIATPEQARSLPEPMKLKLIYAPAAGGYYAKVFDAKTGATLHITNGYRTENDALKAASAWGVMVAGDVRAAHALTTASAWGVKRAP